MYFAAHLLAGRSPKPLADEFIQQLLQRCLEDHTLCLELAAKFAKSILLLIGFPCKIQPSQIRSSTYDWPLILPLYSFVYNPPAFRDLRTFLTHLPSAVMQMQTQQQSAQVNIEEGHSHMEYFFQLLNVWHEICNDLEKQELKYSAQRFEEPLARINFYLLMGLHPMRKAYRQHYKQLDEICDWLYRSAVRGLFYPQCHVEILDGLASLFLHDFYLFGQYAPDSLEFFLEVFSVEFQTRSSVKICKLLKKMLENANWTQHQLLILTNFLVELKMKEAYYTILKLDKGKRILTGVLDFLKILQSKLPSVECLDDGLLDPVLALILSNDVDISRLAAEFYIIIKRRQYNDETVLIGIMDAYFNEWDTLDLLPHYVQTLWPFFPFCDSDIYVRIIKSSRTNPLFRGFVAHFYVIIYNEMQKNFNEYKVRIHQLLLFLPNILEELTCPVTLGILVQIYILTDFKELQKNFSNHMEILFGFESFAFSVFLESSLGYILTNNVFTQLQRCMQITGNWHKLEMAAVAVFEFFRKLEKKLDQEPADLSTVTDYNTSLQRLCIILSTNLTIIDHTSYLFERIKMRLIEKNDIIEFSIRSKSLHDVYATEILTACLSLLLISTDLTLSEKQLIPHQAKQLEQHLLVCLRNSESLVKMPLVRVKTIFGCYIDLLNLFHSGCPVLHMKLSVEDYHILVETMILINFKTTVFSNEGKERLDLNPKRNFEYQTILFQKFSNLHANDNIGIPGNLAWKLCIYYNVGNHNFNEHIADVMVAIVTHHPEIYKQIIPNAIYNLYRRRPPLRSAAILKAIEAHREFINAHIHPNNIQLLKVHIVLTVLQIFQKSVSIGRNDMRFNIAVNRLDSLTHLTKLVADIELSNTDTVAIIINEANNINAASVLTLQEKTSLQTFVDFFEK